MALFYVPDYLRLTEHFEEIAPRLTLEESPRELKSEGSLTLYETPISASDDALGSPSISYHGSHLRMALSLPQSALYREFPCGLWTQQVSVYCGAGSKILQRNLHLRASQMAHCYSISASDQAVECGLYLGEAGAQLASQWFHNGLDPKLPHITEFGVVCGPRRARGRTKQPASGEMYPYPTLPVTSYLKYDELYMTNARLKDLVSVQ